MAVNYICLQCDEQEKINFNVKHVEEPCIRNITKVYMVMNIESKMFDAGIIRKSNSKHKKGPSGNEFVSDGFSYIPLKTGPVHE